MTVLLMCVCILYSKRRMPFTGWSVLFFWTLYIWASTFFIKGDENIIGIAYLEALAICFTLGTYIGLMTRKKGIMRNKGHIEYNYYRMTIIFILALSVVYLDFLVDVLKLLIELSNGETIWSINAANANQRYFLEPVKNTMIQKILTQILLATTYFCDFFSGFYFIYSMKLKRKIGILMSGAIAVPVLFDLLTTNAKLGTIILLLAFISSAIVAYFQIFGCMPGIRLKHLFCIVMLGLVLFSLMLFSFVLRTGSGDWEMLKFLSIKIINYGFGGLYAFGNFFKEYIDNLSLSYGFGTNTFMGIFNAIGIVNREAGVYQEIFRYGIWDTNIYTYARGLMLDFGIVGTMFIALCVGIIIGVLERKMRNRYCKASGAALMIMILFFAFYGFIISPFIYSSLLLAITMMLLVLMICEKGYWACEKR